MVVVRCCNRNPSGRELRTDPLHRIELRRTIALLLRPCTYKSRIVICQYEHAQVPPKVHLISTRDDVDL
jgi:hypothetical protein